MTDRKRYFDKTAEYITDKAAEMVEFSDYLAENPELPGEEYETSRLMVEKLKKAGFDVEYPFCGLPTAFLGRKSVGSGGPVVAILVEYDALPDMGHACGHNVHGTMALYAGMAVGEAIGDFPCELRVVGTPAEEEDGAKTFMAAEGVFDDTDFAFMFHSFAGESYVDYSALGMSGYDFTFKGRSSHAAATPWYGKSAQNGALLFIDALNMMRMHMRDGCRLSTLIREVNGAHNIIPDKAVCRVEYRAPEKQMLDELSDMIFTAARGTATATGTEVSWQNFEETFEPMLRNLTAEKLAEETMAEYGVKCTAGHAASGSTDVGNVSFRCPAIQPEFAITERKIDLHTKEFAAVTTTGEAHEALIKGTRIMADIAVKVLTDDGLRKEMRDEFEGKLAEIAR